MTLISVKRTSAKSDKKLIATFDDGTKKQFGSKTSTTFAEGASTQKKKAYLARHGKSPGERWNNKSAGALSRWVLWEKDSISKGVKEFNKHVK